MSVTVLDIVDATERTCARRFNITSAGSSGLSLLSPPTKIGTPGDVVGRGTLELVRGVAVDRNELEREGVTPVGVAVGIEEEVEVVERLEDEMGLDVEGYAGTIEDEGGEDSTGLVALPFQTN